MNPLGKEVGADIINRQCLLRWKRVSYRINDLTRGRQYAKGALRVVARVVTPIEVKIIPPEIVSTKGYIVLTVRR